MNIKLKVLDLVTTRNYYELTALALNEKGVIRYLLRLLYEREGITRWYAIEGLGQVTAVIAPTNPDLVRDLIRRIFWSMNDESGAVSWTASEAVGEIIACSPDILGDLVPILIGNAIDERIFQQGMFWALGRIGRLVPLDQKIMPELINFLTDSDPGIRGHAAWAFGETTAKETIPLIEKLINDQAIFSFYHNGMLQQVAIHQMAKQAILKLKNS